MNRRGFLAGALAACAAPAFVRYGSLMVPRQLRWSGLDLGDGDDCWGFILPTHPGNWMIVPPDPVRRALDDLDAYYRRLAEGVSGITPVMRDWKPARL